MKHPLKSLIIGAILAIPLLTAGCYYETYPRHVYRSYSYYDDDDGYYQRAYRDGSSYRVGAVWVPGHWSGNIWIRGHWE